MKRIDFDNYLKDTDFKGLFVGEMLWNNPTGATMLPEYTIAETKFHIEQIAERSGFQILTCRVNEIPTSSVCKKLDIKLRKNAENYICIFYIPDTFHHLWIAPVKKVEKRDVVLIEYISLEQAGFLYEKIEGLSFSLDDNPTILDIIAKIQAAFIVNSEKITKDFYDGFKKEHSNFAKFIKGIDDHISVDDNNNKQWYTSVMLNRLMFCYFIQKKGFLDGDVDYLRHKLEWTQQEKGEDRFFSSFYKGFLVNLFHGGLNTPNHDQSFESIYGRIPYLNGGMFDIHQIEQEYSGLDIADEAFISLFDFFDKWHWHLDDRLTATGRDINPDVLGYIFEQYINDRAQMGAYYTKEAITEYIGRNTILPYLMDTVRKKDENLFSPDSDLWLYFRNSGDRYIFDAVKKGHDQSIPDEIAVGIDSSQPNLLELRKHWNDRTPEALALPTEIWRETIQRLQRYRIIKTKIENGEITSINDFITYNLDICQFVYDYLANTSNYKFVEYFYDTLQKVTILDPTCGSGAFLFAALNILEPLYEVCISRMEEFHEQNQNLFVNQLQEVENKYRSNIQYFIYKSIILRNLYGVDIMVEATEIAKLRLFLKMVAVVDVDKRAPNLGLDPLPDIDFNIRCGNTLVGYASEKELEKDLIQGDMFAASEFRDKVHEEMEKVAITYNAFKAIQLSQADDMVSFKRAKSELKERLNNLNETLNKKLYSSTSSESKRTTINGDEELLGLSYEQWEIIYQPFHWLAEFFEIINSNKGFDVIIGNPPYVECNKIDYNIQFTNNSYSNLYAYCLERCAQIEKISSYNGLIVPMSITSIREYSNLRVYLRRTYRNIYLTNHSIRPQSLFTGVSQRVSILISGNFNDACLYTTKYLRTKDQSNLFKTINYQKASFDENRDCIVPKIGSDILASIFSKIHNKRKDIINYKDKYSNSTLYIKDYGETYWVFPFNFDPCLTPVKSYKTIPFDKRVINNIYSALNSTLFYIFHTVISDCWHLGLWHLAEFPISIGELQISISKQLSNSMKENRIIRYDKRAGGDIYEYKIYKSKPIIDEIDIILAQHYGFSEEELDYIINYDIKYRMGDELDE